MSHSCVAVFCEDIREEVGGSHSLIGIMPDNISLAGERPPGPTGALVFPKLGIYTRINLDLTTRPLAPVSARVTIPGANDVVLGEVGLATIQKAYEDASANGMPNAGLIFKTVFSPIHFRKPGVMMVYVTIDGVEKACGALNVIMSSQVT